MLDDDLSMLIDPSSEIYLSNGLLHDYANRFSSDFLNDLLSENGLGNDHASDPS